MDFHLTDTVKIFDGKAAWHYIKVPIQITSIFLEPTQKGLVPITVSITTKQKSNDAAPITTQWKTSILPMGDGTHFIALKKQIRQKHNITIGQTVTIEFSLGQ